MPERRKYERIRLPQNAGVLALDAEGKPIGPVRVLGQGGLLVESKKKFAALTQHRIILVHESERIRREVTVAVRYSTTEVAGFEFVGLDVDAAVEIGVIVGKYYSAAQSPKE
jgi:hypothetical protein